jgi:acetate kinase
MSAAILAINAGSSSLKFAVYADGATLDLLARGEVEGFGGAARLLASSANAAATEQSLPGVANATDALDVALNWVAAQFPQVSFSAIGHRVVHGGSRFHAPVVVDDATLQELESLDPLAPLHQPFNLAAIRDLCVRFPQALPVACFDTAFHAGWDDRAQRIALPRSFHDAGVRRYGFHGLSYEFLTDRMRTLAPQARRVVLAHLGSGASICAARDGRSVDSTMGFSVLDGLPMGTRCGAIDPAVIFHLHRQYGLGFEQIEHMLYYDSGLKGVSGISADMRDLRANQSILAHQAIDLLVYRCVSAIGGLTATLGGIDALVFSGGIGWRSPEIRAAICAQLEFFGVFVDAQANAANNQRISSTTSRIPVFALATDEEIVIARHCRALLATAGTADRR